jgi:hypothetical protein
MGIVTKNAIMLVDFAIEAIAHGTDRDEAIIDAGRKRARPIIMTTIAMVAGMMPSALAFGAGGEFRSPMAIAVIGGLIVSTFLSLVFVPAFFAIMDDLSRLIWRVFSPFVGGADDPPPPPATVHADPHAPAPPMPPSAAPPSSAPPPPAPPAPPAGPVTPTAAPVLAQTPHTQFIPGPPSQTTGLPPAGGLPHPKTT